LAVVAGEKIHAMVEFVDGQEYALLAFAFSGAELGAVGEDGFAALRVLLGDVHDKRGGHAFEGSGVENLERAVGFAGERELLEPGEEASFVAERGGVIVIGVARFPIRKDYRVRAQIANDLREAQFILTRGLHVRVGDAEISTPGNFQDFRGEGGFFRAGFGGAARAHLAGGEIQDAGLVALLSHFDQRAPAGEFDVVGMRGDGENVEFHGGSSKLRGDCSTRARRRSRRARQWQGF